MKIVIRHANGIPQVVQLSETLSYRDWCIVQNSREFHHFQNLLNILERQHNRLRTPITPDG